MFDKLKSFFKTKKLDATTAAELEDILISSDISPTLTTELLKSPDKEALKVKMQALLRPTAATLNLTKKPTIIAMVGVNGNGKTTSTGKLAAKFIKEGKKVSIIAADTFRASAIEQLGDWAKRAGANFISAPNSDPSGLAFEGVVEATKRGDDIIFIDTAGRLADNKNLMEQLAKTIRSARKANPDAGFAALLVLDANGGQNSLAQYEQFSAAADITGIVLTKTEGTAKGGFILTLADKHNAKVMYETFGEEMADIRAFDPDSLVEKVFG
ncbi:MAG: signal recognition particle-docking protein FtsY [Alphaproteobacteria bacterium]|nr:signal recognition particle-docking protein FtsY [Alphaproteobacteria bacterium]